MNRLFILGNGFDLNLGLPTSYKYFYKYYTSLSPSSINVAKLKENIKQYEDKDWKDLELGIGKYTEQIESFNDLEEVYIDLNTKLTTYLTYVDKFKFPFSDSLIEKIKKDLSRPEMYLTKAEQSVVNSFASVLQSTSVNNIVTFNYTHTVENILGDDHSMAKTILHIHRELGNSGVLLGVDSVDQISNDKFRTNEDALNLLVKPKANALFGNLVDQDFSNLIKSANLICLFGVSLGTTDMTWWKKIGNHLLNTDKCRVIYFVKTNKTFMIDQQRLNYKAKCKQYLLEALQFNKKLDTKSVLSRIYVVLDSLVFDDGTVSRDYEKMYSLIFENKYL